MINEPSSPLWTAIKQMYDAWPPDNEEAANQLGTDLHHFATAAASGHADLNQIGRAIGGAWHDSAGVDMADKAGSVADDWSKIAQTAGAQGTLARNYAQALIFVKRTISNTVAANEPLYERFGASSLLHPLRTRLVNKLAGFFQRLVTQGVPKAGQPGPKNSWLHPTVGATFGASATLGIMNVGVGLGLIQSGDGHVALTFAPHVAWDSALGISAFAGGGAMISDGRLVSDQSGKFNQVGASGGDEAGVNGSYAWGNTADGRHVHDLNLQGGVGLGASINSKSAQGGQSTTFVFPIPLPWAK